jgi:hypothetical protein
MSIANVVPRNPCNLARLESCTSALPECRCSRERGALPVWHRGQLIGCGCH